MVERRKILRAAAVFGSGTMLSRIAGLIRDITVAAFFSVRETDMWIVGQQIANLLRQTLGEGAMSMAVVPVLSDSLKNDSEEKTRHIINSIFTFFCIILVVVTILGIIFSPFIVKILVPDFSKIPGKIETTIYLTRIMFPYIMMIGMTAFAMSILNTLGHFWISSFHPVLWNIAIIASAFTAAFFEPRITAVAIGFTIGGLFQLLIHLPSLKRHKYLPKFTKKIDWVIIKKIGKLLAPSLLSISVLQLAIFINRFFAGKCGDGSISYLFWSDRIVQFPIGIFAVAIGTAILPVLCKSKNDEELNENYSYAFKLSTLIMLPATAGMLALNNPIIKTIYQRGEFTSADTASTAMVLSFLALTLYPSGIIRITVPMYYSVKDTLRPAFFSLTALVINTIISYSTFRTFGLKGISTAMATANFVNAGLLLLYFHSKHSKLKLCEKSFLIKIIIISLFTYIAAFYVANIHNWAAQTSTIQNIFYLTAAVLAGGFVCIIMALLLNIKKYMAGNKNTKGDSPIKQS